MTVSYRYRARDRDGKLALGVMSGESKSSVAKHISAMGYTPISVEEEKERTISRLFDIFKAVTQDDVNLFTRQLLILQKAGIPLLSGLNILEKQTKNACFKDAIKEMSANVEEGSSLSDAMGRHPGLFNEFYVSMIKAGEASGLLDETLARLAEFREKESDSRARIKAATRYPMITLGALFVAFIILTTFVIPKFSSVYAQFKTALPIPTRLLLGLGAAMRRYWYIAIGMIAVLTILFRNYINTIEGRFRWDSFKLRVPVFGPIVSMFVMSRFARTMSILLSSGLPILYVLELTSRTAGNVVISRVLGNIVESVRDGRGISAPMGISGVFPPIVVHMVAIGEKTGKTDELLMKVSEYYDQQSDYATKNLMTLIEPAFIAILGVMVLTMALAIFLPMWNLARLFRQ